MMSVFYDAVTNDNIYLWQDVFIRNILSFIREYRTIFFRLVLGRLRGLAVACRTTDHYRPCSNLGVGISEGFVFDFASLPLEVARPI